MQAPLKGVPLRERADLSAAKNQPRSAGPTRIQYLQFLFIQCRPGPGGPQANYTLNYLA